MASARQLFRGRRAITSALAAGTISTMFLTTVTPRTLHAEAPQPEEPTSTSRRSLYDDTPLPSRTPVSPPLTHPSIPTPTDRLALHISRARLTAHAYLSHAEHTVDDTMTRILAQETRLSSTLQSLLPPPSSPEHAHLVPSSIYALVAGMGASIATHRRNVLLRWTLPGAVAVGAWTYLVPETAGNVGGLVRGWGERWAPEGVKMWDLGVKRSKEGVIAVRDGVKGVGDGIEEVVGDGRRKIVQWVEKGR